LLLVVAAAHAAQVVGHRLGAEEVELERGVPVSRAEAMMQGGGGEPRPGGAGFGDGAGDGGGDGCEGGGDGAARRMKHRKLLVLSLSGFCGYTALVMPLVTPAFHFSQRAFLPTSGILTSYPMQSASAEQREPH